MVSTTQIKPHPMLQPFINCYALRVFNTGSSAMPQPLHAVQETYMTFFLKDQFCSMLNSSGVMRDKISNSVCNLFTESQGYAYWKGDYILFCVQFTANGMSAILGIPQRILVNTILAVEDILGNDNRLLTEQLTRCKTIAEMGAIMNAYFIKKLLHQKHKYHTHTIAHVSGVILKSKGMVSLGKLAFYSNMSFRNFERRFVNEVGMPPKLYTRITRFYNALENKMLHPQKNWTSITYESGYFDQAHFIRECKEFSSKTPEELFTYTPPPTEKFMNQ